MTKEELAERLNGIEYVDTCKRDFCDGIRGSLVVVCGASDFIMQFYGAIRNEISCFGGGIAHLDKYGLVENECDNYRCPYYERGKLKAQTILAVWGDDGEPAWTYETNIPHATFDIWDEGERYCRGIIFDLMDVVEK